MTKGLEAMHWTYIFKEHILGRGFDYYIRKLVEIEEYLTSSVKAKVEGTQIYDVEIEFDEQGVAAIYCDCPHAAEGNYCKHAAAVLYTVDRERMRLDQEEREINIEELVNEADEQLVRTFLIEVLKENGQLINSFKRKIGHKASKEDLLVYKNTIDEFFYANSDSSGFIHYYDAMELEADLGIFIEQEIENNLLNYGYHKEAFELISKIFVDISKQELDDSGGTTTNIAYRSMEIWNEILNNCTIELKREIFQWFKDQLNGQLVDYMEEYVEEIIFDHFTEQEFLEDKLTFAKEKFDQHKNEGSLWYREYKAQEWGIKYLELLKLLNEIEKIDAFCQNNLAYPRIREFYVNQLLDSDETKTAIKLLEDGKNIDGGTLSTSISRDYRVKLKELYKKTGNEEAYRKELWGLIIDRNSIDFEHYQEYKNLYTKEEWAENRLTIIKELSDITGIDKILVEEELYDLLMEYVMHEYGLHHLQTHQDLLVERYPKQVFDHYEKEIMSLSELSGSRKKYRQIVSLIRQMQYLPNSKERVAEIISNLKTNYKNRPAMMDELSKL